MEQLKRKLRNGTLEVEDVLAVCRLSEESAATVASELFAILPEDEPGTVPIQTWARVVRDFCAGGYEALESWLDDDELRAFAFGVLEKRADSAAGRVLANFAREHADAARADEFLQVVNLVFSFGQRPEISEDDQQL